MQRLFVSGQSSVVKIAKNAKYETNCELCHCRGQLERKAAFGSAC